MVQEPKTNTDVEEQSHELSDSFHISSHHFPLWMARIETHPTLGVCHLNVSLISHWFRCNVLYWFSVSLDLGCCQVKPVPLIDLAYQDTHVVIEDSNKSPFQLHQVSYFGHEYISILFHTIRQFHIVNSLKLVPWMGNHHTRLSFEIRRVDLQLILPIMVVLLVHQD